MPFQPGHKLSKGRPCKHPILMALKRPDSTEAAEIAGNILEAIKVKQQDFLRSQNINPADITRRMQIAAAGLLSLRGIDE